MCGHSLLHGLAPGYSLSVPWPLYAITAVWTTYFATLRIWQDAKVLFRALRAHGLGAHLDSHRVAAVLASVSRRGMPRCGSNPRLANPCTALIERRTPAQKNQEL